ncbi:hypothetical protein POTOM_058514 [Populus tomentosa]|uniref:Uncharacterized protein n=1 Tax=Populus tomentosa TaxID=118781 RepID=A0A8X8BX27_POPTO|nr:hypothetical protein POTOM_058514 [Populus tomentosa]
MPEKLQHVNRGNIQEFTNLRLKVFVRSPCHFQMNVVEERPLRISLLSLPFPLKFFDSLCDKLQKTRNPIQRALVMIDDFSNTAKCIFRVRKLKNQLDMMISKNASKFSSSREFELLAACDAQASSASSPTFSAGNGDAIDIRSYLFCNSEYSWIQHWRSGCA